MSEKKSKTYTAEFKESAVKLAVEFDQPVTETARDLGVNANTLHTWIGRYHRPRRLTENRLPLLRHQQIGLKIRKFLANRTTIHQKFTNFQAQFSAASLRALFPVSLLGPVDVSLHAQRIRALL